METLSLNSLRLFTAVLRVIRKNAKKQQKEKNNIFFIVARFISIQSVREENTKTDCQ